MFACMYGPDPGLPIGGGTYPLKTAKIENILAVGCFAQK